MGVHLELYGSACRFTTEKSAPGIAKEVPAVLQRRRVHLVLLKGSLPFYNGGRALLEQSKFKQTTLLNVFNVNLLVRGQYIKFGPADVAAGLPVIPSC
jgi:hypothetical protein